MRQSPTVAVEPSFEKNLYLPLPANIKVARFPNTKKPFWTSEKLKKSFLWNKFDLMRC